MAEAATLTRVPRETPIVIDFDRPGETRTTWGEFVDAHADPSVDMDAEELAAIEAAIAYGYVYAIGIGGGSTTIELA